MSASADTHARDRAMLDRAALAALRAAGDVEPNPPVGCIVADPAGRVIGFGHHRRFGGPHAEVEALLDAQRRGESVTGATAWVTLEPCQGSGKTGPCTDALIRAGVRHVVYACPDPHTKGAGGAEALRSAGVATRLSDASPLATWLSAPHRKRTLTGQPWVVAKWAQTAAGRIHSAPTEARWISCPPSRRRVHRLRSRVDMVVTGIGTVLEDDPLLTARGVPRVRRAARRVVFDPALRTPPDAALLRTIDQAPVTIVAAPGSVPDRAEALRRAGAEVVESVANARGRLDPREALAHLAQLHSPATILLEAGPALLESFLDAALIDEAWVFIAPGERATPTPALIQGRGLDLLAERRSGVDTLLIYGAARSGVSNSGH